VMKRALKVEAKWKEVQESEAFAEMEEDAKAAGEAKVAAAKAAAAEAETKYNEIKGTFEPDPLCTKEWMNNLLDVAKAGVQTFVVGGTFWPCTDMMNLFTTKSHFKDCEKVLTVFKNRYIVERSRPMSFYFKMVPNIFLETDEAPVDYNPLLNDMLKSTGQEVSEEPEEGVTGPKLDLVQLYWWDCDFSDYVKAAKSIIATGKVTALGLVNFPLPALKNLHRAGVDIATLEVNYPIGALEKKEYTEVIDFCKINGIKVLLSNALVGGIMSGDEMGKLMCPGDSFREPVDPQGPKAEGKFRIQEFGGWIKFQALLMCLDEVAKKHKTTLEAVALRYYINKGVHPIIPVPWGKECGKNFPNLQLVHTEFLEPADMDTIGAAFNAK
jgi:diketogulonate reductase-like aldo/keto reductase